MNIIIKTAKNHIIIQEQNQMPFFTHLRQIKLQIIQYQQVFRIAKLYISSIFCSILKLLPNVKPLQISEVKLPQHKDIWHITY